MNKKRVSAKENKSNSVKKFTKFISQSSHRFLSSFLDEDSDQNKRLNHIYKQINQAILQKKMVVLHYKEPKQDKHETLIGRIYQHSYNKNSLVVRLQHTNEVRMISAKYIKKLSIIQPNMRQPIIVSK